MSERAIHEVAPKKLDGLTQLSGQHRRTIEEEHKAILREALLNESFSESKPAFEPFLSTIPNVGNDLDVARVQVALPTHANQAANFVEVPIV